MEAEKEYKIEKIEEGETLRMPKGERLQDYGSLINSEYYAYDYDEQNQEIEMNTMDFFVVLYALF